MYIALQLATLLFLLPSLLRDALSLRLFLALTTLREQ
jgi:hypothetical protein